MDEHGREQILDYLYARMTAAERERFEQRMTTDAALREAVRTERDLNRTLDLMPPVAPDSVAVQQFWQAFRTQEQPRKARLTLLKRWGIGAAGIAACMCIGAFLFWPKDTDSPERNGGEIAEGARTSVFGVDGAVAIVSPASSEIAIPEGDPLFMQVLEVLDRPGAAQLDDLTPAELETLDDLDTWLDVEKGVDF